MKNKLLLLFFVTLFSIASFAQETVRNITGSVKDANGESIIGANVMVEGTTVGTITNMNGAFSLKVPENGDRLVVSFIGYQTKKVSFKGKSNLVIILDEDAKLLSEVVVTALGIKREKKALGYAMQEVKTDDFSENRAISVSNLLQGKVAGVQISQSGSGLGSDTRIVLRGLNSLSGNNSPLWVVDGLPSLTADINSDDIESISVLKGANAAALYGSRAQSGAIVITTKKGKEGKLSLEYNGYVAMTKAYDSYEFQDVYGQGSNGEFSLAANGSWGPKMEGQMIPNWRKEFYGDESYEDYPMLPQPSSVEKFFDTGLNYVNSVSASGGNENINARFSFTDSRNKGIIPNQSYDKQNYNLNVNMKGKYLSLGVNATYHRSKMRNKTRWNSGIWSELIQMPRNIRLQDLQNPLGADGNIVNWAGDVNSKFNPYELTMNENGNVSDQDRFSGQVTLTGHITDYLKVTGRLGYDKINRNYEDYELYVNRVRERNDFLEIDNSANSSLNADLMLQFDKRFKDFSVVANVGMATYYYTHKELSADSGAPIIPGFLALSNGIERLADQEYESKRINSVMGNATLGYKDYLFLDVTARNDWSSTLPKENCSYFYPSVSVSTLLSEIFKMPSSYYLKVRGSLAQVGNDTTPYSLYNAWTIKTLGNYTITETESTFPLGTLKPEKSTSYEVGFDYRMFGNRLGVDFTYYHSTTVDQILSITVPGSSGYERKKINSGKMVSKGVELMITTTPIKTKDWQWTAGLNWGMNKTHNVSLNEKIKRYTFSQSNSIKIGSVVVDEGGKFGDIVGTTFLRDEQGRVLVNDNGLPIIDTSSEKVIGNMMPKWIGSFNTSLSYKDISFNALVDIRYKGQFLSLTDAFACGHGNSAKTLQGRDGMVVDGIVQSTGEKNTKEVTAQQYYETIGGLYPVGEAFLYDATYVKLRELSVGYVLPKKWFRHTPISKVKVSVVGRDLFNIYKAAPVNAEYAENAQDIYQAYELASLPSTRTVGFSLNVRF